MTFVVTEACIRCKYMDCVDACPVDCFREGENMLVIAPDLCIDCAACWSACPAAAIKADSEPGHEPWLEHNRTFAAIWPAVHWNNGQTFPDADIHRDEAGKFGKYFSPAPGKGH